MGGYHGHADLLLVQAGSGVATLGLPDSPGVPPAVTADTLSCAYNDLEGVKSLFARYPRQIAAIIVEPVAGNMGVVTPDPRFLPGLRDIATEDGALLVFDEVMSGFRVHMGGAQARYAVRPDLTVLGKVIGGGLPVGAYGGRAEIMGKIAPAGPVYQAGTLSGNPLAMTAGIATLTELGRDGVWAGLERTTEEIATGLAKAARAAGVDVQVNRAGSMLGLFFAREPVTDWESAKRSNLDRFARYFRSMLEAGVYLAPSQFEACFVSTVHGAGKCPAPWRRRSERFGPWPRCDDRSAGDDYFAAATYFSRSAKGTWVASTSLGLSRSIYAGMRCSSTSWRTLRSPRNFQNVDAMASSPTSSRSRQ